MLPDWSNEGYKCVKALGSGSFATAYLVENQHSGRKFVAKALPMAQMNEDDYLSALKEASILQCLKHPLIVGMHDILSTKEYLVIIMEFCEAGDLHTHVRDQAQKKKYFPENKIVRWFVQMALGVENIHK
eukprot:Platyproteum_vivax@DN14231_c0_g1_i1.p1